MRKTLYLLSISVIIFSCSKEDDNTPSIIEGCTDSFALNFDPSANSDDGSCYYSYYDIVLGSWNITPDCDEFTIPIIDSTISLNDQLPENIDVQGGNNNLLYIEIGETQVNGNIDNNGNIIVPKQTISLDMGFGSPMDIDVEGSGSITSPNVGNMDLTYSFDIEIIPGLPSISEEVECAITLSR